MPKGATGSWVPRVISLVRWKQVGAQLDPLNASSLRWSSTLVNNGNTLAVGDNESGLNGRGIVRIYDWNGAAWVPRPVLKGENENDYAGNSVALSSDGNVLAIGEPEYIGGADQGRVRVFDWNGAAWTERGDATQQAKLVGASNDDEAGYSVALSSDGNVLAIGEIDYPAGDDQGRVRVFDWNGAAWTERGDATQQAKLVGASIDDDAGFSVALSSDGNVLAIGERGYDNGSNRGRVRVFDWNGAGAAWTERGDATQQAKLVGENNDDGAGYSVALSSDGNVLAIGEPKYIGGTDRGRVRVFDWNGAVWTERGDATQQAKLVGENTNDDAGYSVALSSDGNVLAIGEIDYPAGDDQGRVRVFDWNGSKWTERGYAGKLVGSGPGQYYSYGLSLSADGRRLAAPAVDGTIVYEYS